MLGGNCLTVRPIDLRLILRASQVETERTSLEYAPGFRSLCYVSLEFSYLFDFEEFLSWHNPTTAYGQTTQIEFSRPTGIIAVVHILPLFKEPVH